MIQAFGDIEISQSEKAYSASIVLSGDTPGGRCIRISTSSAVLSSIANVGPGFEQVNAHSNYSIFSTPTKLLLTFLMMLGRLEIFTMIALFLPSFWKKY